MSRLVTGSMRRADGGTPGDRPAPDRAAYTTVVGDFYRGEVERATAWRSRLDQTTNWAVVVVAAILTWAFSGDNRPHYVVLIGVFGVTAFLLMEANRYREYDVWRNRVRTVQRNLIAETLAPSEAVEADWQARLADELRTPSLDIPFRAALTHRLRRTYLALLLILGIAWVARITVFVPDESWMESAAILTVPGEFVVGAVAVYYGTIVVLTGWSARSRRTEEFES